MRKIQKISLLIVKWSAFLLIGMLFFWGNQKAYAAESSAGKVSVKKVDYDKLLMTLDASNNSILYYSTDKKKWNELEYYIDENNNPVMDISWISATSDTKVYFKGNGNETVLTVTFPKRNTSLKATFNKAEGTIAFDNYGDATGFEWRKSTDYCWSDTIPFDETNDQYQAFIAQLEALRTNGCKIFVRTPSEEGKSASDMGIRPSKEVSVTIAKRSAAPSVKLNVKNLTVNTTVQQEYSIDGGKNWVECEKNMELKAIVPQVFGGAGVDATVMIRKAATETLGYSKTCILPVAAQRKSPGSGEISAYQETVGKTKRYVIGFPNASKENPIEYVTIKPGKEFDETKAAWKSVTSSKVIKLSQTSAPEGTVIYFRYKGVTANATKNISAVLPSVWSAHGVSYTD